MSRLCTNCLDESVDETKQSFIYRDGDGNKWDACIKPLCNLCIEAGEIKDENGIKRLYIGVSRRYKEGNSFGYGYWQST